VVRLLFPKKRKKLVEIRIDEGPTSSERGVAGRRQPQPDGARCSRSIRATGLHAADATTYICPLISKPPAGSVPAGPVGALPACSQQRKTTFRQA
jgi:hypothetical protein